LESRYKKEINEIKDKNLQDREQMALHGNQCKNKNEKLQRVLIDKENDLLRHQEVVADLEG
jgi:hypothetical protein